MANTAEKGKEKSPPPDALIEPATNHFSRRLKPYPKGDKAWIPAAESRAFIGRERHG